MRFLRIISSMNPENGGVVAAVDYSARSLVQKGVAVVDVLTPDDANSEWLKSSRSYVVHAVGGRKTFYSVSIPMVQWLFSNAKRYDLIIIDGLWRFNVALGYLLRFLNVPYVVMPHGMLDPYFNRRFLSYLLKLPFWFLVERNVLALANCVLFTCEEELRLAQNSFPFFKNKACLARLGFDFSDFEGYVDRSDSYFRAKFSIPVDKKIILFMSRVDQKKGVDVLFESISRLRLRHSLSDYIFVVAGPVDSTYKKQLEKQILEADISHLILWVGMLSGRLKWSAYESSDFFVLPSHQENYGIVIVEALSVGLPVLITNKVNISKEIVHSGAGLVSDDDAVGVVEILDRALNINATEYEVMSKNASICYEKYFSDSAFSVSIEELLRELEILI
jgi:glycosyltransferase involved in cell wall biosynthesis